MVFANAGGVYLDNRQDGKARSPLQDGCWDALLRLQKPDLGKAVQNVGGLVHILLQAAAEGAVQPGAHDAAICHVVDGWLHCLRNGACKGMAPHDGM